MTGPRPWEGGDERDRWNGYLDFTRIDGEIGYPILRNLVDANTARELRTREDHFATIRSATMQQLGIPSSYDLDGLQQIHGHLFQDVYEWAGELRTVNISKGAGRFAALEEIEPLMAAVADGLRSTDRLNTISDRDYPEALATVYNSVNTAHPFREGNGRTQRLFIDALAAESGHRLDWTKVHGPANDYASEKARTGDLTYMVRMFREVTSETPEREAKRLLDASRGVAPPGGTRHPAAEARRAGPGLDRDRDRGR